MHKVHAASLYWATPRDTRHNVFSSRAPCLFASVRTPVSRPLKSTYSYCENTIPVCWVGLGALHLASYCWLLRSGSVSSTGRPVPAQREV